MTCIYNGAENPRVIKDRHDQLCESDDCTGCLACPWSHCRRCGKEHSEHTCPGCLADVREDLTEILRLCAALPAEAVHRGINSEAMNLMGPVADPEMRGHVEASYRSGRLPEGWIETGRHGKECPLLANEPCTGCGGSELHPLTVLGWWSLVYVEAFQHAEPARITVASAGSYLDRNLAYAGAEPDVPFEDMARQLSACRSYLERVLHDGEQVETGAPCVTCRAKYRKITDDNGEVSYHCRCQEVVTEDRYRMALRAEYINRAEMLTFDDMAIRTGIPTGTLRRWASVRSVKGIEHPPMVRSCATNGQGKKVYRVADVERIRDTGGDLRGTVGTSEETGTVSNEGAA